MKKLIGVLLIIAFCSGNAIAQFAGGNGTEEDPYQISTVEQLQSIRDYADKHFIQVNDIDASETIAWNDSAGFEPIGSESVPFIGSYNGGNYKIDSLIIYSKRHTSGLFRSVRNGTLVDIDLLVEIHGNKGSGGLVAAFENGEINNVKVSGEVYCYVTGYDFEIQEYIYSNSGGGGGIVGILSGDAILRSSNSSVNVFGSETGGIVGDMEGNARISYSFASGEIRGSGGGLVASTSVNNIIEFSSATGNVGIEIPEQNAGGLVGLNYGKIINSYATGNVTGSNSGGLVGKNDVYGSIQYSFATGNVYGYNFAGGLLGTNEWDGEVLQSYSSGNVGGRAVVGGLVGNNIDDGKIKNSFTYGAIDSSEVTGGFIGINGAIVKNGYWGRENTSFDNGVGEGYVNGIFDLTTEEMNGLNPLTYMQGLDFKNTWILTATYPALYWEDVEAILLPPEMVILLTPQNEEWYPIDNPYFEWAASENAEEFIFNLSKDDAFSEFVLDTTISAPDTSFTMDEHFEADVEYFWRVKASNESGESEWSEVFTFLGNGGLSIKEESLPTKFTLQQNYPNPFNPTTLIRYGIPEASEVQLEVYNMLGQKVAGLVNERKTAGWHTATFDASQLSSGFYIYRIKAKNFVSTKKLMLIK